MSVSFNKSGIVNALGSNSGLAMYLVDENNNDLLDETSNYLTTGDQLDEWGLTHGFIEGLTMMSVYDNLIMANEFIEW